MLFFGDLNARIEYFLSPSFESPDGLRILKDSTNNAYLLEVKRIANWKEVENRLSEKYPSIGIPGEIYFSTPENIRKLTREHNNAMYRKREKERLKLYAVETQTFPISHRFAEALYAGFVTSIEGFVMKGRPAMTGDGYSVTFRCVVDDDVWTLTIQNPRTVRSVQTNRRRRGSGPIRRIEVYRTAGRLRAGGLQLRQSKKLPGSQAYCKRRSPRLFI